MEAKKIISTFIVIFVFLFSVTNNVSAQFVKLQKSFEPNNSSTFFTNSGVFNQNISQVNTAGYVWPINSALTSIFTTGLNIAALVNDSLTMAAASYTGEYRPGTTTNCVPYTDTNFRIYKIKKGDNASNNPDYANWGAMVPYGAPYFDVNNNGQYDPGIDKPGVRGADQTIFICLTDGYIESHTPGEGFGGGTLPLYADLRITAWGYNCITGLENVQFIKFQVINKNIYPWTHTFMGLFADPDLGDANDDYIGYDVLRKLGYCYNADNNDPQYGAAPPAVGFLLLKGAVNHSVSPNVSIDISSFNYCTNAASGPVECEQDPFGEPVSAYNYLKGFKRDGSPFMNPTTTPYTQTKFVYTGDPETNSGWTEKRGSILNCGGTTGQIRTTNPSGDRRLLMGMGAENFTLAPNDTQTIVIAQLIARGSSNLNSVTKLLSLSNSVINYYNNGLNFFHSVTGNIKYSDNNQAVTSGSVKVYRFSGTTPQIVIFDSAGILPNGDYTLTNVPVGESFIGAVPNSMPPVDFVPTYYPSTINWQNSTFINPTDDMANVNIRVYRINSVPAYNLNGVIYSSNPPTPLKEANVYVKSGDIFVGFNISGPNGIYTINTAPSGTLKIIVDRLGYNGDSSTVFLGTDNLDSVNFYLTKASVNVKTVSMEVPTKFFLYQNYPNPFNPVTKIKYQILKSGVVLLKIYDILGKEVAILVNEMQKAGIYELTLDASGLPSGIYFYQLKSDNYLETKKFVLLK
jgi:hypothetical protein